MTSERRICMSAFCARKSCLRRLSFSRKRSLPLSTAACARLSFRATTRPTYSMTSLPSSGRASRFTSSRHDHDRIPRKRRTQRRDCCSRIGGLVSSRSEYPHHLRRAHHARDTEDRPDSDHRDRRRRRWRLWPRNRHRRGKGCDRNSKKIDSHGSGSGRRWWPRHQGAPSGLPFRGKWSRRIHRHHGAMTTACSPRRRVATAVSSRVAATRFCRSSCRILVRSPAPGRK